MIGTAETFPAWVLGGAKTVVYQESGEPLELTHRLASGGQGEVWAAGRRHVVKLLHARSQSAAAELHRRLRVVKRLDLSGLPLSVPLSVLRPPYVGYVMELLDDMVALQHLSKPPSGEKLLAWYIRTGGLRRRLRLLGWVAGALADVHARGMAYGDPSPTNVLVSEAADHEEVRLIDVDNIAVASEVRDTLVTTPGYAAPELLNGRGGITSLSDAYAFAVMAFETLAVVHPFMGDAVYYGEPELQEQAFSGQVPWIDHRDDATNRSGFGIGRRFVLTQGLARLADQTFGSALHERTRRPTVGEWRSKLYQAADMTLRCSGCQGSFYAHFAACPWCRATPPPALVARVQMHVPGGTRDEDRSVATAEGLMVQSGDPVVVTARTTAVDHDDPDRPIARLYWDQGGSLNVRNLGLQPLWLAGPDGRSVLWLEPGTEQSVPGQGTSSTWSLHFGPRPEFHRLLTFAGLQRRAIG